jgi:arylsulfatase
VIFLAQEEAANFLATFKEFPPSQRAQNFTVDQIIEKMQKNLESVSK